LIKKGFPSRQSTKSRIAPQRHPQRSPGFDGVSLTEGTLKFSVKQKHPAPKKTSALQALEWVPSIFNNDIDRGPSPFPLPQAGEGNKISSRLNTTFGIKHLVLLNLRAKQIHSEDLLIPSNGLYPSLARLRESAVAIVRRLLTHGEQRLLFRIRFPVEGIGFLPSC
jgi:hypothetical protein